MKIYPKWADDTPRTDASAKISRFRSVTNVRAIRVKNAFYRNAVLSGTFELEEQDMVSPIKIFPSGKQVVRVICGWHSVTPKTKYPRLTVTNASYDIIKKYTGQVADNIS